MLAINYPTCIEASGIFPHPHPKADPNAASGSHCSSSSPRAGTAATVTFAFDPNCYAVTTTTVDNVAFNADGSVAYSRILNTSAK